MRLCPGAGAITTMHPHQAFLSLSTIVLHLASKECLGSIISSSQMTRCVVESSPAGPPESQGGPPPAQNTEGGPHVWGRTPAGLSVGCSKKLVVSLTVPNGQVLGTETVEALLTKVADNTGQGDAAVPTVRQLAEPYKITVTKTPVYVVYPLTYIQTFNGRPYELVATTKKCDDSSTSSKPTCGWFKNDAGAR